MPISITMPADPRRTAWVAAALAALICAAWIAPLLHLGERAGRGLSAEPAATPEAGSLSARLAHDFPVLASSLAVTAEFSPATWQVAGAPVMGLEAAASLRAPAGLATAERAAWLAMAERQDAGESFRQFFPRRFDQGFAVRACGLTVWSLPLGGNPAAAEDDAGRVVYRDAYPSTAAVYTAGRGRGEEFLFLADASAPKRFAYGLGTPEGHLHVAQEADGGLLLSDGTGRRVRIEAPWVVDATGCKTASATHWEVADRGDGRPVATLVLDPTGLVYPLVIDPTWAATGSLVNARYDHRATLLPNGKVLVSGGQSGSIYRNTCELFDPVTGTWSTTGNMITGRSGHAALVLPSGLVLVAGGNNASALASCEIYNPGTGAWSPTGAMSVARKQFTSTLLGNGKVLAVGGTNASDHSTCELYNPAAGTWSATGSLSTPRQQHTATLLPNGKVLAVAGKNGNLQLATCQLYDPAAGTWSATGNITGTARIQHATVLLGNGQVLLAGGIKSGSHTAACSLYNPATGTWTATGSLAVARYGHTLTLLPSGKVLVANDMAALLTTELYDPVAGTWSAGVARTAPRARDACVLLPSGQLLMTGGINGTTALASCECYDATAAAWSTGGSLAAGRVDHISLALPNGKVMAAGGVNGGTTLTSSELYDPSVGSWAPAGNLGVARSKHAAVLLASGKVLTLGGLGNTGFLSTCEVYDPATNTWSPTGAMSQPRVMPAAVLLPSGWVMVSGGYGSTGYLATCELYNPSTGAWFFTASMSTIRAMHGMTLLPTGKILVTGGYNPDVSILASCELYNPANSTWSVAAALPEARYSHTATVLPSGKLLVAGGSGSTLLATCSLYNPATNSWAATGSLTTARYLHRAVLLPSGQVLACTGTAGSAGVVSAELYDPAKGLWQAAGSLSAGRRDATCVLLTNGNALVIGGRNNSSALLADSEVVTLGLGYAAASQPVISSAPATFQSGQMLTLGGSLFTGRSEASGGVASAPTSHPLVRLQSAINEQACWLPWEPSTSMSATGVTVVVAAGFPAGPAWMRVFANGIPGVAKAVTIVEINIPIFMVQPANQTVNAGGSATFTAVVSADPAAAYQWYKSINGGSTWMPISGATATSYTTPATVTADNNSYYRVEANNGVGAGVTSNAAQLTVRWAPVINSQPNNQSALIGASATFMGSANANPSATYQWSKSTDGGTSWNPIGSAMTEMYQTPPVVAGDTGTQFRITATNVVGSATSNPATLTVVYSPEIVTQPVDVTVVIGQAGSHAFSVTATGTALQYQWFKSLDGGNWWSSIQFATAPEYTPPAFDTEPADSGTKYRVRVSNNWGQVNSIPVTLFVHQTPTITAHPTSQTVVAGATATFSVTSNGAPTPTHQWSRSNDNGASWAPISGATAASYATPATAAGDNGARFRVAVSNAAGVVTSNVATLTVNSPPVISQQPADQSVLGGQTATFTVTAYGNAPLTYQWSRSTDGGATWQPASGVSASSHAVPSAMVTDSGSKFRVVISNALGETTSDAATLAVQAVVPTVITTPPLGFSATTFVAGGMVTSNGGLFVSACGICWSQTSTMPTIADSKTIDFSPEEFDSIATGLTPSTTYHYRAYATNAQGTAYGASQVVTTAAVPPVITTQPANQTVTAPAQATFTVVASGQPTYQWSKSTDGGSTWTVVGGSWPSHTTPPTMTAHDGTWFRVVATNSAGSVTSTVATLTVQVPPLIITHPMSQTAIAPESATFSVSAATYDSLSPHWNQGGGLEPYPYWTLTDFPTGPAVPGIGQSRLIRADNSPNWAVHDFSTGAYGGASTFRAVTASGSGTFVFYVKDAAQPSPTNALGFLVSGDNEGAFCAFRKDTGALIGNAVFGSSPLLVIDPQTFAVAPHGDGWLKVSLGVSWTGLTTPLGLRVAVGFLLEGEGPAFDFGSVDYPNVAYAHQIEGAAFYCSSLVFHPTVPALTYQWGRSTDGGGTWVPISGAAGAAYATPATVAGDDGSQFRVVVANGNSSVTSHAATLTVHTVPVITLQPVDQTVVVGGTATFSATATGIPAPVYQWSRSADGGATWGPISGATAASYTTPETVPGDTGARFRITATNSAGSAISSSALLTVDAPPVITGQPVDQVVLAGQSASLSVNAIGAAPLSYLWSRSTDAGATWTPISGATAATYATPPTVPSDSGARFRVAVSNALGSETSTVALLTVHVPPVITVQPVDQTVTAPTTATFAVTANGNPTPTYQWSRSADGTTWTAISGAIGASYNTPATTGADHAARFRVTVDNAAGTATSAAALLTVNTAPVITLQPGDQTVTAPATAIFTVSATGTPSLSYQWSRSIDSGTTWSPLTGETAASYTTPATAAGDHDARFRVAVSTAAGSVESSVATLTVNSLPVVIVPPADQTVTAPDAATFAVTASGTPALSYQWSQSSDGGVTWTTIPDATAASYTKSVTPPTDDGARFRVALATAAGTVSTSAAILTVHYLPVISAQPADQAVIVGLPGNFSVTASGNPAPTYQWSRSDDAGTTWSVISGATAASYGTPATTLADNGRRFRVTVGNSIGSVTSNAATLAVSVAPPPTAATPVFTPASGSFNSAVTVTASCATDGAVIRYTTDGSAPTAVSPSFPTSLTLAATTTLRAIAIADGLDPSDEASASFVIGQPAPALSVSPASAFLGLGRTRVFQAATSDGSPLGTVAWSASSGSIDAAGVFTASSLGSATITASAGDKTGTASVTVVPGPQITGIIATPSPVTGTSVALTAQLTDDIPVAGIACSWSVVGTPPAPVAFSVNDTPAAQGTTAYFSAPGSYQLRLLASDPRGLQVSDELTLTVERTVTSLAMSPSTATLRPAAQRSFTVAAKDQFGVDMALPSQPAWSATGGSITAGGVYTAGGTPGTFAVTAQFSGATAVAEVVIIAGPALSSVTATPALVAGTTTQLQALIDAGASLPVTYRWSLPSDTPDRVSFSINNATQNQTTATFTAAGTYKIQVTATDAMNRTASARVTVTVQQTLSTFTLYPTGATLTQNHVLVFDTTINDQFGRRVEAPPVPTWSATSGTIDTAGRYVATAAGASIVTASIPGFTRTANLTVSAQQLSTLGLTPYSATVAPGGTLQFVLSARDTTYTPMAIPAGTTWNVTGGASITQDGLLTAGTTGGAYHDVTVTNGSVSTSATVLVAGIPVITEGPTANPAQVATGTSTALSVTASDSGGATSLTYAWSGAILSGTGGVSFSPNFSTSASSTTATFTRAGTYILQVTVSNAYGRSTTGLVQVQVDGALTTLAVTPATVGVIPASAPVQFAAGGRDQFLQPTPMTDTVAWSVSGGGTIDSVGLFTPSATSGGPHTVTATLSDPPVQGTATIHLAAPPVLTVVPSSQTITNNGLPLSATAQDPGGQTPISYRWTLVAGPFPVSFSPNNSTAAGTTTAGFFRAGDYQMTVAATNTAGVTTTSAPFTITVQPTATSISLDPAWQQNVGMGRSVQFQATVRDQFSQTMAASPGWSVPATAGSITAGGLFTAGSTAGTYAVTATSGSVSQQVSVQVGVAPVFTTEASATPNPVTGTSTTLSAVGADPLGGTVSYYWSALEPMPAGVSFSGQYSETAIATFSAAGTYHLRVRITNGSSIATTSDVIVVVTPTPTALVVLPAQPRLALGASRQFTAFQRDQFDVLTAVQASWNATGGGTIDAEGRYTAPAIPGTATVSATATGSGLAVGTTVTIADSAPLIAVVTAEQPVGGQAALAVQASDDGGGSNLTYHWTVGDGSPGPVAFTVNGTTSAAATAASFTVPGIYTLGVTVVDQAQNATSATVGITVPTLLEAPRFSPAGAVLAQPASVTIQAASGTPAAAEIWYTVAAGGIAPADPLPGTSGAIRYQGPITVTASASFKAVSSALVGGSARVSPVATASFVLLGSSAGTIVSPPAAGGTTFVSPHCIEIAGDTERTSIGVDANGAAATDIHAIGPNLTYANVPLAIGRATIITTRLRDQLGGERRQTRQVTWAPRDLTGQHAPTNKIVIRRGDSLLLTAQASGQWTLNDGNGHQSQLSGGDRLPVTYPNAGEFTAIALQGSAELGSLRVVVVDVPFTTGVIAAEVDYQRRATVTVAPSTDAAQVVFVAADSALLTVSTLEETYGEATLGIEPLARGMPVILARLGSADGPIVSWKPVDEFEIDQVGRHGVLSLPHQRGGEYELPPSTAIVIRPSIPGVMLQVLAGVPEQKQEFTPASIAARFDPRTRETVGVVIVNDLGWKYEGQPTVTWSTKAFQAGPNYATNLNDRVQVGEDEPITATVSRITRFEVTNVAAADETTADEEDPRPTKRGRAYIHSGVTEYIPTDVPPGLVTSSDFRATVRVEMQVSPAPQQLMERLYLDRLHLKTVAGDNIQELGFVRTSVTAPGQAPATQSTHRLAFSYVGKNLFVFDGAHSFYAFMPELDLVGIGEFVGREGVFWGDPPLKSAFLDLKGDEPEDDHASGDSYQYGLRVTGPDVSGGMVTEVVYTPPFTTVTPIVETDPLHIHLDASGSKTVVFESVGISKREPDHVYISPNWISAGVTAISPTSQIPYTFVRPGSYSIYGRHADFQIIVHGSGAIHALDSDSGAFNALSGGDDGPTNPNLAPSTLVDGKGEQGSMRLTGLSFNGPELRALPFSIVNEDGASVKLRRDHAVKVFDGTQPVFGADAQMEATLSDSAYLWAKFTKDDELNLVATGTFTSSFRLWHFTSGLGAPTTSAATLPVCPGHAVVNLASANLFFSAPVAAFGTPAMGPDVTVFYNSRDNLDCGLGRGWRTNYDMRVYRANRTTVLVDQSSARIFFSDGRNAAPVPGRSLAMQVLVRKELEQASTSTADFKGDEAYKLTANDNHLYYFNQDGWLVRIRDLRGQELIVTRDAQGIAQNVRDSSSPPRQVSLLRSSFGDSGSGTQPLQALYTGRTGEWAFDYDARGNMTSIIVKGEDGAGVSLEHAYSVGYDDHDRVTTVSALGLPTSHVTTITYPTTIGDQKIRVESPLGVSDDITFYSANYVSNFGGGITNQGASFFANHNVDPGAAFLRRHFDGVVAVGNLIGTTRSSFVAQEKATSPFYETSTIKLRQDLTYDARTGNLATRTAGTPSDPVQRTDYAYTDLTSQDASIVGANLLARVTERQVTGVAGAAKLDLVSAYTYEHKAGRSRGQLLTASDPAGAVITHQYEGTGNLDALIDARGKRWRFGSFTPYGQPQTITTPTQRQIAKTYRDDGLVLTERNVASGYQTGYGYTARGQVASITHPGIATPTTAAYGPLGHVVKTTDVEGRTLISAFDALGRPTSIPQLGAQPLVVAYAKTGSQWDVTVTRNGARVSQQFTDALGRPAKAITVRSLGIGGGTIDGEVEYHYNPTYGWLDRVSDERDHNTSFTRDDIGRVTGVTRPTGTSTVTLNGLGWTLEQKEPELNGVSTVNTTSFSYTATGQTSLTVNPAGGFTQAYYDPAGNAVAMQQGMLNPAIAVYDDDGRQMATVDIFGQRTETKISDAERLITVTPVRAPVAKVTTTLDPATGYVRSVGTTLGTTHIVPYPDGSVHTVSPPGRATTTRARDDDGRTLSVTTPTTLVSNPNQPVGHSQTYDPTLGHVATATDPLKRTVTPTVRPTGEVDAISDNANPTTPIGQILLRDPAGNVAQYKDAQQRTITQTFDSENRIASRSGPGMVATSWTYTPGGQVKTVTRGPSLTEHRYDKLGMLIRTTQTGRSPRTASYDCYGRVLQRSDGLITTAYSYYPGTGQLAFALESTGKATTYLYDTRGRRTGVLDNQGHGAHYEYDDFDRVTAILHANGKTETFAYHPNGKVHTHKDRSDRTVTYAYQQSGDLASKTWNATGAVETHSLDLPAAGGAVSATQFGDDTTTRVTDVRGRLTSVAMPGAAALPFTYNGADQRVSKGSATYDYDTQGRLWHITVPGEGTATFAYDANQRVESVTLPNGVIRTFGYDAVGAVASMQQQIGTSTNSESWTVTRDGRGHITQVLGPAGLVLTFTYDTSGRLIQEARAGDLPALTQFAYDGADNRTDVVSFAAPATQSDAFTTGPGPEIGATTGGTWSAADGALNASATAAATSVALLPPAAPAVGGPGMTVTAKPALPGAGAGARSAAGFAVTAADGSIYRALWQLAPPAPGQFSPPAALGRLLVQRIPTGGGAATTIEASAWVDDAGLGQVLSLTVRPDQWITARAAPIGGGDAVRIDAPTPGIASTADIGWSLTVAAAGGAPATAAFDDLVWTSAASRTWSHSTYDAFNTLVGESAVSTDSAQEARQRSFFYDDQGNLTSRTLQVGAGTPATEASYLYDTLDRMTSSAVGGVATAYTYYGTSWLRRRASRPGQVTDWTYDGSNMLSSSVTTGGDPAVTTYLTQQGKPLWEKNPLGVHVYGHDPLGNVSGLVGPVSNGTTTANAYTSHVDYDAFGTVIRQRLGQLDGSGAPILVPMGGPLVSGPRAKGMWLDGELKHYKTQTRNYAPDLARFTQVDPIKAGQNWYAYASGDPVNKWDPTGLWDIDYTAGTATMEPGDTWDGLYDRLGVSGGVDTLRHWNPGVAGINPGDQVRLPPAWVESKGAQLTAMRDTFLGAMSAVGHIDGDFSGNVTDSSLREMVVSAADSYKAMRSRSDSTAASWSRQAAWNRLTTRLGNLDMFYTREYINDRIWNEMHPPAPIFPEAVGSRVSGTLRIVGGGTAVVGGIGMSETVVLAPVGGFLVFAGGDQVGTGVREWCTGEYGQTLGSRFLNYVGGDGAVGTLGGLAYDIGPTFAAGLARQSVTVLAFRKATDPAVAAAVPFGRFGHVGVTFNGGRTVWGFGPKLAQGGSAEELAALAGRARFPGVVGNHTEAFRAAEEAGLTVLRYNTSVSSFQAGSAVLRLGADRWAPGLMGLQYMLPLKPIGTPFPAGAWNCATYPGRLGLNSPAPSGWLFTLPAP